MERGKGNTNVCALDRFLREDAKMYMVGQDGRAVGLYPRICTQARLPRGFV